jgi:hypothetical protein
VTGEPLVPGPLYGLRTWRVVADEGGERLAATTNATVWPAGGEWLVASCARHNGHSAPAHGCDCGVHAWHPRRSSARRALGVRREVAGIVEADGAVELHEEGFRAERARPHALVLAPGRNGRMLARLAERYGVPVVEVSGPDELVAWCRERGLGLDAPVVARLLGPEPAADRRRNTRRNLIRLVAALAIGALLVVAGSQLFGDPGHDLYGRTGKIEQPTPGNR